MTLDGSEQRVDGRVAWWDDRASSKALRLVGVPVKDGLALLPSVDESEGRLKPLRSYGLRGVGLTPLLVLIPFASAWSSASQTACAGGPCRGVLKAGTYKSRVFQPKLTYTVPGGGWANFDDENVNFSLAPPGVSLAKAKEITDVILLQTTVQAPQMTCTPIANAKVPQTVGGIVRWLVHQKKLTTTRPRRVTIGGLKGYSLTVRVSHGAGMSCGGGPKGLPLLYPSNDPGGEFSLRAQSDKAKLYLLSFETLPLAIIADSVGKHGPSLAADSKVISHFHFA